MKKEWKNPAVEELNFTNTNNDELIKCPEDNEVDFLGCAPDHTGNASRLRWPRAVCSAAWLFCPRHLCYGLRQMRRLARASAANLCRLLCRRRIHPLHHQEPRHEAGGEHQQGSGLCGKVRRPAADDMLHRQSAERRCRSGCSEYEPDVRHR